MRIIDKTPFVEEDGSISIINRIQGTLQNGFSWYGNLQAQERALAYFDKQFDKSYTLIRNHTLGGSKITIPFILIGTPGIYVFMVTNLEGTYRAKGSSWGKIDGEKYKESGINLVARTIKFAKAVDVYLKKQNITLSETSNPILLALSTAMHIETIRPAVRIVMSDALDRFSAQIRQAPPIMSKEDVHAIAEALQNPIRKTPPTTPEPESTKPFTTETDVAAYDPHAENSGVSASKQIDDIGFSFDDNAETETELPPVPIMDETSARPAIKKRRKAAKRSLFGMTNKQLIILAVMAGFIALMLIMVIIIALFSL
jgi:hypothetical protein